METGRTHLLLPTFYVCYYSPRFYSSVIIITLSGY